MIVLVPQTAVKNGLMPSVSSVHINVAEFDFVLGTNGWKTIAWQRIKPPLMRRIIYNCHPSFQLVQLYIFIIQQVVWVVVLLVKYCFTILEHLREYL